MKTKPLETAEFGLAELSAAFGVDSRLLKRRLAAAGVNMGAGGWTVRQAHEALSGDGSLESLRRSRIALQDTQQLLAETELRERSGELVDVSEFAKEYERRTIQCVQIIEASTLTPAEKDALRAALAGVLSA